MTDALINDKPQFVRLFTENGLNILDYLTYGRLESLYRSVADGTMLYQLLQRRLVERLGTVATVPTSSNMPDSPSKVAAENMHSGPVTDITLFEVSFCLSIKNNEGKILGFCVCFLLYLLFHSGCRSPGAVNG